MFSSSPFKGEARRGMGHTQNGKPIPTPALPLKGREQSAQDRSEAWVTVK